MIIVNKENLSQAIDAFKKGKTVVFPTETSYGLGCDATNQSAVDKIFKIKHRSINKPLLVVVSSVSMAKKYLVWNKLIDQLAKKYWPGALTIVGLAKQRLTPGVVSKDNTIAVRVSSSQIVRYLSSKLGGPIVATSANIGGEGDVYTSYDIQKKFTRKKYTPDVFLDSGDLPTAKPSTIVSVINNELKVLRKGDIDLN